MTRFRCRTCFQAYPETGLPFCCPNCGGIFTLEDLSYHEPVSSGELRGIWRYANTFGLPDSYFVSYLGEGETPLVPVKIEGREYWCKLEHLNPSGSFKDRATAVLANVLRGRGIKQVAEDSSGNAGGSLALYARAFDIDCRIYIPSDTSGPKRRQIEVCGADVRQVEGSRENAHKAVLNAVMREGLAYASHAMQPFGMAGIATISYEIFETLGAMPDTIICPIGHGSLFAGVMMGFNALVRAGKAVKRPRMIGVQPEICAPLLATWRQEPFLGRQGKSLADGTMVETPARAAEILAGLDHGRDLIVGVSEPEIGEACRLLIRSGLYVEPTSALALAASRKVGKIPGKSVLILSGTGLKSAL
ncbi:MAG: pyridoxal-phosphate dependent enzyme [Anaerolineaceae bacterium]|nr:pyridoxal-phosphate dependent enzyme [Chloroflexota bacterium]